MKKTSKNVIEVDEEVMDGFSDSAMMHEDNIPPVTPSKKKKKRVTRKVSTKNKSSVEAEDGQSRPESSSKKIVVRRSNTRLSDEKKGVVTQIIVFSFLLVALLASAIAVIQQVNDYRRNFALAETLRTEEKKLNTEWHKLLLEQQTFGATTRIGGRALLTMNMYSPRPSDIISVNIDPQTSKKQN